MESLIELCHSVSDNPVTLDLIGNRQDNSQKLFEAIRAGQTSEEELRNLVASEDRLLSLHFFRAKDKLISRLTNTLLVTKSEGSEIQHAYFDCYRKFAAYKILVGKGKRRAAIPIAKEALKIANKYHFSEISLMIAKGLRLHYSESKANKKQFTHYAELTRNYQRVLNLELEIEDLYCQMVFILNVRKKFTEEDLELFREMSNPALNCISNPTSFRSMFYAGNIAVYYYQSINDTQSMARICRQCVDYFESLPQMPLAARFSFLFKTIPAYIKTGHYKEAEEAIDQCRGIMPTEHINHYKAIQYNVILKFHSGDYEEALQLMEELSVDRDKETWYIFNAYARLLNQKTIRLGKLLNEVPNYSKEKRGTNINVLIIHILTFLSRKEFGKAIDRMDAIRRYADRYLLRNDTFRSNCFIRMLLQLEKGHFNRIAVERHAKKYYDKLLTMPFSESTQDLEVEPVPYERLWGYVLEMLG